MYKRQVSQVTEAGTRIEREYYIDQALTTIQKKKGRDRRKRWCRLLSGETPEPWFPVTRQPCVVLAESVWKPARTLSPPVSVLWLNYTGSVYYPPLNYSLLTTKIVPCHPCFSSHGFPSFLSTLIQRVTTVIVSTASTVYSMWLLDGYFCFPKFISIPAVYLPRLWEDTDKIIGFCVILAYYLQRYYS